MDTYSVWRATVAVELAPELATPPSMAPAAAMTATLAHVAEMNPLQVASYVCELLDAAGHPKARKVSRIMERWAESYEPEF